LLSLFLTAVLNAQNLPASADVDGTNPAPSGLEGQVLGADGQPASDARVELHAPNSASPVTVTYTRPDGTFALYNIPKGSYEVVAESGDVQVSDQVTVQLGRPKLELRLPLSANATYGSGATVSVAQMLVPERAQKEYRKARQAFVAGKNAEALPYLDNALQIAPEFAAALTLRGIIEMDGLHLADAEESLEQAIHHDPNDSAAYLALGVVYNHEARYDDAMNASQHGVSLSPRSWQGYFEMAKAAIGQGMYEKALQFARQAEKLGGSGFAGLHLVKAYALVPLKLYRDAKCELQAYLSRAPKDGSAKQAQSLLAQVNAAGDTAVAAAH
jgi:tetratricopeptide (TPR) repeat protein